MYNINYIISIVNIFTYKYEHTKLLQNNYCF